jgi:transposase
VAIVHRATGVARSTIKIGQDELAVQQHLQNCEETNPSLTKGENSTLYIRHPGGGRKNKAHHFPGWEAALEKLIEPLTRGDPESPLRWTIKSTKTLSEELSKQGFQVSPNTVMRQLHKMGYSLKSNAKVLAGKEHPDRNAQFEHINDTANEFMAQNNPVISVDTKKKETLGNFKNPGEQWSPKGSVTQVNDHDFPDPKLPRALPFGIYDINQNFGHVVVGTDNDTSEFAANSIYGWWKNHGESLYKEADRILITADCGGSNRNRGYLWKYYLQKIADQIGLPISVCHFPPGTSKWNKIEHKLFSFISSNWRGEPLVDYETIVNLISATKTKTGLEVSCVLDDSNYEKGIKLTKEQISEIKIIKDEFHGEWNYTIYPH